MIIMYKISLYKKYFIYNYLLIDIISLFFYYYNKSFIITNYYNIN
jgi:hypothetical protein